MQNRAWTTAIAASADPQRAQQFFDQLKAARPDFNWRRASEAQAQVLMALFSGSQALGELLLKHPDWLETTLTPEALEVARPEQGLRREVEAWLAPAVRSRDYAGAFGQLREFKQREALRVAARDLARLAPVTEIIQELSDLADVCLDGLLQLCRAQLSERMGQPYHLDSDERWQPTAFSVIGLGKLGGQELNYSSDVDVMFVYTEEGQVFKDPPRKDEPPGKGPTNHVFFKRLAEAFIAEIGKLGPEGMLYRIDLRLRPEGDAGPLVRSLDGYENYYAQWGQTWERMMLIKARGVAGDTALAEEFLEMIQPFRYPRSLGSRLLVEVGAMKERIEQEVVKAGELDRNVKLGRGGIREIEFTAQTLQLLHAGKIPFLQNAQTLPALAHLARYKHLATDDALALTEAYVFLRDVEHRLQMEANQQTHTIPNERKARERLARLMGYEALGEFEKARESHARAVRGVYDQLLKGDAPGPTAGLPRDFQADAAEWRRIVGRHAFRDADQALRLLQLFVHGPGYAHVSARTVDCALELVPRFLALCPRTDAPRDAPKAVLSDPDRVLARLDSFITAYGARATLYDIWVGTPAAFEMLLWLFDRSEFLAEVAIRTPDLVDELASSGRLRRSKTGAEILTDLSYGRDDADQRLWLRRYHQAELMRIGLRDILGLADFERNLVELSALADACLQYALEVVMRRNKLATPPFAIIGLGKLGGIEINYGSDLDVLFVTAALARQLPGLQKLAAEVMDLLASPTELGVAFAVDARLRPDGEKGLLVNSLEAHEEYYRHRAQLWELQAISRARFIAGAEAVGQGFQTLVAAVTDFRTPPADVAAYTPNWKAEIAAMRVRIQKERTPAGQDALAIKTGTGGLMDAEFVAQALCLGNGWAEPNTLSALRRGQLAKLLPEAELMIENYRKLRHVEGILRRWSFAGETVLPDEPAPFYRVSVRCGFGTPEAFAKAVGEYRGNLRKAYTKFFAETNI